MEQVKADAKIIWDYMLMHHKLVASDVLLILGSRDDRVASYAAALYKKGLAPTILVSGGVSLKNTTAKLWAESTEAEHFASIMQKAGVPAVAILEENEATNTGENIIKSYALLKLKAIKVKSLILVHKPYMERRAYGAFKKQWPDKKTNIRVNSPPIKFDSYFNENQPFEPTLQVMVGDLERIIQYPDLGFEIY